MEEWMSQKFNQEILEMRDLRGNALETCLADQEAVEDVPGQLRKSKN